LQNSTALSGKVVAVPESRQLDILAQLLEKRGAQVMRVPLVAIHDAPDSVPVLSWMERFVKSPPEYFIILTGEGVKRWLSLAEIHYMKEAFVGAFRQTCLICRGPKPDRVLREIGLKGDLPAKAPTTAGVIVTLGSLPIEGKRIGVQLYGDDPNTPLMNYLASRQVEIDAVAPYVYADAVEDEQVLSLIHALNASRVDAIAFTSQPQFRRMLDVARKNNLEAELDSGLASCCVAAVGPVVAAQLKEHGVRVDLVPELGFFMKPLVTAIMKYFVGK